MSSSHNQDVVIVAAKRTPFGAFGGSLRDVSANDLGAAAARAALEQAGAGPDQIDQVIFGNVLQTSGDAIYHARHVGLKAGLPVSVPALTVNRLCGSGFQAVISAAEQIMLGHAGMVLCGGAENMSMAPHVVRARWGIRLGQAPMTDALWEALTDTWCKLPMALTAEKLAAEYGITREQADEYGYRSHMAYKAALERGVFDVEMVPYTLRDRKGRERVVDKDECPRLDTTPEKMAKLPPVFKKDGIVTAGNASAITDGAAALVVTTLDRAHRLGVRPLARIVSWGIVGVEPSIMGIGPVGAIRQALDRAGLTLDQMDRIEVNEAFAPQYLAVEKELGLDRSKTNVNGGAISIGHPLAASGARITAHLCYELERIGGRYGIGSACIGGGQGIALLLERVVD